MSIIKNSHKKVGDWMIDKFFSRYKKSPYLRKLSKYMPLKVAIICALTGVLWIMISDRIIYISIKAADEIANLQIIKEFVFLSVITYFFYSITSRYVKDIEILSERFDIYKDDLKKSSEKLSAVYEELQHKEKSIKLYKDKLELIVEGTSDIVWEWEFGSDTIHFTDRITEILGYGIDKSFKQTTFMDIIHPKDRLNLINVIKKHISGDIMYFQCEFRIKPQTGDYKWVLCRGKGVKDNDEEYYKIIGSLSDITNRRKSEEKLIRLAYYDSLTGLPNRALFEEQLGNTLAEACKAGKKGSILFIGLDDFKRINDSLGHGYGDQLIKLTAEMLKLTMDKNDELCRFGGDEFIIMHPECEGGINDTLLAKRILDIFKYSFEIGEKQIYTTASIGIASYPKDGTDVSTILKNADAAMYEAKKKGKNVHFFYNKKVISEIIKKNELEKRIRSAIENDEFYLMYQPQLDLKSGQITSLEALIRWECGECGTIMPAEFIPIAEESGFIIEIGAWVIKNVCIQCNEWKNKGYKFDSIGVNISPVQLKYNGFIDMVNEILLEFSTDISNLEFEITENVLIQPFQLSIEILRKLQSMGGKVSLDDFGTGYSSLNYLRILPINSLKIDKTFIDNIFSNLDGISIVEGIISLAHKMNLTVTAEGVETEEQFNILKEKQCDKIQGYFISRPLSKDEIEQLLQRQL